MEVERLTIAEKGQHEIAMQELQARLDKEIGELNRQCSEELICTQEQRLARTNVCEPIDKITQKNTTQDEEESKVVEKTTAIQQSQTLRVGRLTSQNVQMMSSGNENITRLNVQFDNKSVISRRSTTSVTKLLAALKGESERQSQACSFTRSMNDVMPKMSLFRLLVIFV